MRSPFQPFLILSLLAALVAVPRSAMAEPGDEYTIQVLTMSPGDPIFFRFGHNAIWVHDSRTGRDEVFNWGTFSFDEPGLITKFLQGRLTYWLSVQSWRGTLAQYQYENRSILAQELDLTGAQKQRMVAAMRQNARPENRAYRYDYYRDNCSTRVRDVINEATDGAVRAASNIPSTLTFRSETNRLTADVWWGYVILNMSMGSYIDQPIMVWDEMFIPERVGQTLRKAMVVNSAGQRVPLVKTERLALAANRDPPLDQPPRRMPILLVLGCLGGGLLGWLSYRALSWPSKSRLPVGRRLAIVLPLGVLTTLTGFIGCMFVFLWTATDHAVAYHNENLLQASPLSLAMPVILVGLWRQRPWARTAFCRLAYVLAGSAVLGLLLKAMPWWFRQVNGGIIALLAPIWLGLAIAGWKVSRFDDLSNQTQRARSAQ